MRISKLEGLNMSLKYHKKLNNLKLCNYCCERFGRIGYR